MYRYEGDWEVPPIAQCSTPPQDATPTSVFKIQNDWSYENTSYFRSIPPPSLPFTNFRAYIASLPQWQQQYLKDINFHQDILSTGLSTIRVWLHSDGSYTRRTDSGSYGWILSNGNTTADLATGTGAVYALCGSSYRSELEGILACLQTIYHVIKYTSSSVTFIRVYTDSKTSIKSIRKGVSELTGLESEWDMLILVDRTITDLQSTISQTIKFSHVKGRQDDTKNYQDLPVSAQKNVKADHAASSCPSHYHSSPYIFPPPVKAMVMTTASKPVTSKLRKRIRNLKPTKEFIEALKERWGWLHEVYLTIDWETFSDVKPSLTQKAIIPHPTWVKLCTRTLPVGYRQHRIDPSHPASCPSCGHSPEYDNHLYNCQSESRKLWCGQFQKDLQQHLRNTSPPMADLLIEFLMRAIRAEPMSIRPPPSLRLAYEEQIEIGPLNSFCGHLSYKWSQHQHQYLKTTNKLTKRNTGRTWAISFVKFLQKKWILLWRLRTDDQHGHDNTTRNKARRARLLNQIRYLDSNIRSKLPVHRQSQYDEARSQVTSDTKLSFLVAWVSVYKTRFETMASRHIAQSRKSTKTLPHYFSLQPPKNFKGKLAPPAGGAGFAGAASPTHTPESR